MICRPLWTGEGREAGKWAERAREFDVFEVMRLSISNPTILIMQIQLDLVFTNKGSAFGKSLHNIEHYTEINSRYSRLLYRLNLYLSRSNLPVSGNEFSDMARSTYSLYTCTI